MRGVTLTLVNTATTEDAETWEVVGKATISLDVGLTINYPGTPHGRTGELEAAMIDLMTGSLLGAEIEGFESLIVENIDGMQHIEQICNQRGITFIPSSRQMLEREAAELDEIAKDDPSEV